MKASEIRVQKLLSSANRQFVIPVYQRNYDWDSKQCEQLFQDIEVAGKREDDFHFIGSIVYLNKDIYATEEIEQLILIDGQQRLTTLILIYLSLYYFYLENNMKEAANKIYDTYLVNKYAKKLQERYKLRSHRKYQKDLEYLFEGKDIEHNEYSRLINNFNYFKQKINLNNYSVVDKGLQQLLIVEIALTEGQDNPQRIFESLNSTGLGLSEADLIRNHILMNLNYEEQEKAYRYWERIEEYVTNTHTHEIQMSDFIRNYLMIRNNESVKENEVYRIFKKKFSYKNLLQWEEILKEMQKMAFSYQRLINPKYEENKKIAYELNGIKQLAIKASVPFLMQVYQDYDNQVIEEDVFVEILKLIQSFIIRRAICDMGQSSVSNALIVLYRKINKSDYVESLKKELVRRGKEYFPDDELIYNKLKDKKIYKMVIDRRIFLFERLENFNHNKFIQIENNPLITIEHIFPQKPNSKWKQECSARDFDFFKNQYLHTIGNLTLSGNSGALENKTFIEKRDLPEKGYRDSKLWLNKDLATYEKWSLKEWEKRTQLLTQRFLEVWPYPDVDIERGDYWGTVDIFQAPSPAGKKLDYVIFLDKRYESLPYSTLYELVLTKLFEENPSKFEEENIKNKLGLNLKSSGKSEEFILGERYFIKKPLSSEMIFQRIKYLLSAFEYEGELVIKYVDKG